MMILDIIQQQAEAILRQQVNEMDDSREDSAFVARMLLERGDAISAPDSETGQSQRRITLLL